MCVCVGGGGGGGKISTVDVYILKNAPWPQDSNLLYWPRRVNRY